MKKGKLSFWFFQINGYSKKVKLENKLQGIQNNIEGEEALDSGETKMSKKRSLHLIHSIEFVQQRLQ